MLHFLTKAFSVLLIILTLLFVVRWVGDAGRLCRRDSHFSRDHYVCWRFIVFEGDDFFSFLRVRRIFPGS